MFRIIGHRFFSAHNLENSMAGALFSISNNAWALETDIQLTRDNVPVLMHDKLLDRTTNQKGYIKDWTYSELISSCRLNNNEEIPSLEKLFHFIHKEHIKLYLEIIDPNALNPTQILIEKYSLSNRVVISSFHHKVLIEAKKQNPLQCTMALFECNPIDPVSLVKSAKAEEAGIGFESIESELVENLCLAGIKSYAWTVNDKRELKRAKEYGLSGIFTDQIKIGS